MTAAATGLTPLQRILERLPSSRGGDGQYTARCPAHDDREPSLSIGEGTDGKALVKCHAGCPVEAVVAALGLSMADLFPTKASTIRWLREHVYHDDAGRPVYRVRRGQSRSGARVWRTEHPTSEGWRPKYDGPRVLYRLPRLINEPDLPVWLCEGERDADSLAALGMIATSVVHSTWRLVDTRPLNGRTVNVVVDADAPGWKRGKAACKAVVAAGGRIGRVYRPIDGFKDVTEQLAAGQSIDFLTPVDLTTEEPPVTPPDPVRPPRSVYRENGLSYFVTMPSAVLLGLCQAGRLEPEDPFIYLLLLERAGESGLALLSGAEIGRLCRMERHAARRSLVRLADCGLVEERRRGQWTVYNPARSKRSGVDRALTYRDRDPSGTPTSSSKNPSTTSPANGAPDTTDGRSNGTPATTAERANGTKHTVPEVDGVIAVLEQAFGPLHREQP